MSSPSFSSSMESALAITDQDMQIDQHLQRLMELISFENLKVILDPMIDRAMARNRVLELLSENIPNDSIERLCAIVVHRMCGEKAGVFNPLKKAQSHGN